MKIKKVYENKEISFYYYIKVTDGHNVREIHGVEDMYEHNYDSYDLKDVVRFLMEEKERNKNKNNIYTIEKLIAKEIDNEIIEKIMKEIELENNSNKYNL